MKKTIALLTIVFLASLVVSCGTGDNQASEDFPGIKLSINSMNKEILLLAPLEANTFKFDDNVNLVLENYSNVPLIVAEDYGIRVYKQEEGKWKAVENNMGYQSGEKSLLPKSETPTGGTIIPLHPNLTDAKSVVVRVMLTGTLNSKTVGAYKDVTLHP